MFTGLIETTSPLLKSDITSRGAVWTLAWPDLYDDLKIGDSVALNGVCTTVVSLQKAPVKQFTVELSPETLRCTSLSAFGVGQSLNLERPLLPHSRMGGHFVMGHVDCTATVKTIQAEGNSYLFAFSLANRPDLMPMIIPKGSITINGISLTVNSVEQDAFSVAIIPHTWEVTTIHQLQVGDAVNIEVDMLGKYVYRFWSNTQAIQPIGLNPVT